MKKYLTSKQTQNENQKANGELNIGNNFTHAR